MSSPSYNGTPIPILTLAPDWDGEEPRLRVIEQTLIHEALDQSEERWQRYPRPLYGLSFSGTAANSKHQGFLRKFFEQAEAMPVGVPLWTEQVELIAPAVSGSVGLEVTSMEGTLFAAFNWLMLWSDWNTWEVLACDQVAFKQAISLSEATTRTWAAGTRVMPVAFGYCSRPSFSALSAASAEIAIEFEERFLADVGDQSRRDTSLLDTIIPEITYTGCKDEITVAFGTIPGLTNVTVYHADAATGPWRFWTETREPVTEIALGNYFAGRWLKLVGEGPLGTIPLKVFQPDPPNVLPPTITVRKHHNTDTDYTPAPESPYAAPYPATSAVDPEKQAWVVSESTRTDPLTEIKQYEIPLFSPAFVEIQAHLLYEYGEGGGADGTRFLCEVSSDQAGATCKLTLDGSDPTPTNGLASKDLTGTASPYENDGLPYSVIIARAFKDGCASPPVYVMVDTKRDQLPRITTRVEFVETGAGCQLAVYENHEIRDAEGNLIGCETVRVDGGGGVGGGAAPCPDPYQWGTLQTLTFPPVLWDAVGYEATSGLTLSTWQIVAEWGSTPPGTYYGPPTSLCPSTRYGGGMVNTSGIKRKLTGYNYQWDPSLGYFNGGLFVAAGSQVNDGQYDFTAQNKLAAVPSAILGPDGGDTNHLDGHLKPLSFADGFSGIPYSQQPGPIDITNTLTMAWLMVSAAKLTEE